MIPIYVIKKNFKQVSDNESLPYTALAGRRRQAFERLCYLFTMPGLANRSASVVSQSFGRN
jgi:hypothetical protein